ncbi:hypothetical protein DRQ09_08165, partial [candidate division KSB1 bacterium]
EKQEITVEWIYSNKSLEASALPMFVWLNDGTAILYDFQKPAEERTFEKFNPVDGKRTPILNVKKAIISLKSILGKDYSISSLPWPVSFDKTGEKAIYIFKGDIFVLLLKDAKFIQITNTKEIEKSVNFSPDGKKLAFVRNNNLYIYDIEKRTEKQITVDGSETILNGTLSWVYWEEIFGRRDIGYWWSYDSEAIAFLHTDDSSVGVMRFLDFKPQYPRVIKQRYPKVGTANPVVRIGIAEINSGKITWAGLSVHSYAYVCRVKWLPDSKNVSVQTMNRNQTELNLYFVDRYTGKPHHILKETDSSWVNINDDLYFLKNGEYFIWASERTGYAHLYRYKIDGTLVNQITKGNWSIRSSGGGVFWLRQAVTAIDEDKGWIYFTSLKKSSIERHLYRIRFDGTDMQRLTREDGFHSITFSPNAKYYFDNYSNISTLPSLTLHRNNGEQISVIARGRPEFIEKFNIQYPELLTIPAEDGFPMPAQILKPEDFSPWKKYPVIINVYGGPSAPQVSNSWQFSNYFDQILLQKGYLVVKVDNRCATAISKKLENTISGKMYNDGELKDLLSAVRWLKSKSYIDPERVGIWGWSGGATFTLLAMTHSKEFKAGIAVAPVTNWRYYDTKWAESGMKLPQDNQEGYEKTNLVKYAKNLHGRLLLVHGTYDDNVHIQNSWDFINELIKANIMFDMMIYPMRKHGISDRPARIHLFNKMVEFWTKNL